ncbi:MAG: gamma-glutamylcyclotransferase [Rhodospirillaceae bacterium]|jgi:hypothetical protein|nr:gamma-glutamylcyclotransferase [Rhodospirillaceae bacterium]MBT3929985.1 gamma-glutamylcyclotransferase [Rhodospirillaceae bacterium]MBT5358255.1 gamma-glutamylcyclotransferase [Rhodospirillaceae bacterium]MBT5767972.1 gamma-glutamylcyclotransferase [Rhodospirillaceae bacterium]MBT6310293.1 gamma-glutamylcyclotransferase [Rhodospirillaceae bacterium]
MTTDPFETDPVLMRAVGYPYDITAHSFTFIEGEAAPFDAAHTIGRRPVIGYGSNQSPLRLRQKYGTDHAPIPVQRAWLDDHDVVFAAHFAGYGALPAALRHVPGTRVAVAVTWLSDAELAVMHPTEIEHYHFARLEGLTLDLDGGETIDAAWAYLSFRGHVGDDGTPFALSAVAAEGRQYAALSQREALALMRDRIAPDEDLAAFVRAHIDDPDIRASRVRHLQSAAVPVAHASHKVEAV